MITTALASVWRRILLGAIAIVGYGIVAATGAFLIPERAWPAIGDDQYSSAQATIVPALNVFALAMLCFAIAAPLVPRAIQVAFNLAAAVVAAVAGPLLARFADARTGIDLLTPGTAALLATGILVGLTLIWATDRLKPRPH
ncbi:hypothetical protein [Glycomyces sp. YM15]|uniref:hypothetical protein n=1 Tax=Glycomyces sp. YM15 TaxID=2800446 RepID=UPI0019669EEB|nr:hypothetical protein [Glycomyces sp. YM15]